MIKSSPKTERFAGVILVGLLLGAMVTGVLGYYLAKTNQPKMIPIERAMYVADWEITKIYGPGTPEQKHIVDQFRSMDRPEFEFNGPVLYRMGGGASVNGGEGILLIGFDPKHPEMAKHLKAEPSQ